MGRKPKEIKPETSEAQPEVRQRILDTDIRQRILTSYKETKNLSRTLDDLFISEEEFYNYFETDDLFRTNFDKIKKVQTFFLQQEMFDCQIKLQTLYKSLPKALIIALNDLADAGITQRKVGTTVQDNLKIVVEFFKINRDLANMVNFASSGIGIENIESDSSYMDELEIEESND